MREHDLQAYGECLEQAAMVAQNPEGFEELAISVEEKEWLRKEKTHRWSQPFMLFFTGRKFLHQLSKMYIILTCLIVLCGATAIVQGMDETAVNGAQMFYTVEFGLAHSDIWTGAAIWDNTWLVGLINGAPYLACCLVGVWLTKPVNHRLGRRGAIFLACASAFIAAMWQALSPFRWVLLMARLFLGLSIGLMSTTTPVYAAECAPASIRGALCMMWQMWTAFGIMLGYVATLALFRVSSDHVTGLNWRLVLGTSGIPYVNPSLTLVSILILAGLFWYASWCTFVRRALDGTFRRAATNAP